MNKLTINNVEEAQVELTKQLSNRDWYMHNYRLLDSLQESIDESKRISIKCGEEFDENEAIYNYLTCDNEFMANADNYPMEL